MEYLVASPVDKAGAVLYAISSYSTLYGTVYSTTVHNEVALCGLINGCCTVHTVQYYAYSVRYTVHCTVQWIDCILYTVHCTVVYCTVLYNGCRQYYCTLYTLTAYCTLYTVHAIMHSFKDVVQPSVSSRVMKSDCTL
ncbi:uncharacterized protein TRIADDRAFT_34715 [Trichoplax adhaerens]|uniref:Uncharacterized protein n=1 Tax=Trichoplax adhaerens TaxID=10228 RepID=B3SEV8_TRIAD|nr:predicted protein [Trichoplax adhaerens]EDV18737.1 predicted protein [Trichoplax adhaerens]|eukprot:XP_002118777.1 predicted protein [Trichoplax adhaerens]